MVGGKCFAYGFWPSVLVNHTFGICLIFVQFIIPLIILIYCYGGILWVLTKRIVDKTGKRNSPRNNFNWQLARTNTIKTFLLVGLCFIICWSNDQIYFLMYNLGNDVNFNSTYYKCSNGILKLYSQSIYMSGQIQGLLTGPERFIWV